MLIKSQTAFIVRSSKTPASYIILQALLLVFLHVTSSWKNMCHFSTQPLLALAGYHRNINKVPIFRLFM